MPIIRELIVSIRHLVYVIRVDDRLVCRSESTQVTYTRCRMDTINSPDDEHMAARNM